VLKVEIGACLDVEMAPVVALMPWVQTWAPAGGAATGPEVAAEARRATAEEFCARLSKPQPS